MDPCDENENGREREVWETEVLARHRWGQHGERASEELGRLKKLWEVAQPLDEAYRAIADQIVALEICNWNLEESILALCSAIGEKEPATLGIGHMASMSEERWKKVWAYYLSLRDWFPCEIGNGYELLLRMCDPDKRIQDHVSALLRVRNELKELYVERLCLCLEFWLGGYFPRESARMRAQTAAVAAVEREIRKRDPKGQILEAFQFEGDGKLNPCHHKLFRRYDIILSSIGVGTWRGGMPAKGTDGFERADTLEKYLAPIEKWVDSTDGRTERAENGLSDRIHGALGEPDSGKVFLASLLISLLRSQQLEARKRAESRAAAR